MRPSRILGLVLATSSVARAALVVGDRLQPNLARALVYRADDQKSSTDDNILSDIINTSKVGTDKPDPTPTNKDSDDPKTTDKDKDKDPETTKEPPNTNKPTSEPTNTKDDDPKTDDDKGQSPTAGPTPTPTDSGNNDDNNSGTGTKTEDPGNQTTPAPSGGSGGNSGNDDKDDDEDDDSKSSPSVVIETKTTVITTTNSNGEEVAVTSTSTTTTTPGLSGEDSGDAEKGMPEKTRNTVIGVVVGIGSAIILGALGFVFWRIRSRKRNAEETDGLMSYDPAVHGLEKGDGGSIGTGHNPFQSTLENYHRPTQVNPSANF